MPGMQDFNQKLIEEFRANGGKVSGQFQGRSLALLTTKGARTGRTHTTPVAYFADGDRLLIVASKGGAPTNPAWYYNLVANPTVTVEIGEDRFEATASVPDRAERDALFAKVASAMPGFGDYQKKTTRVIPVVVLRRTG
jgi:deazaflavin-dependent oxidoreductase (nitroreductase family)